MTLLDSNILLRLSNQNDPNHRLVDRVVNHFRSQGIQLFVVPQCMYEFWVVATRPTSVNGLGMNSHNCEQEITRIESLFTLLPDQTNLYSEWRTLVKNYAIHGKPAHDARLVAAMRLHNLSEIVTFNVGDFQRYPGITILDPRTIAIH